MDKKLIAAFTFGLLAVSAANVLLSVGIVSLLLTWSPGTDVQVTDAGNFPGTWMETMNAMSLTGMNNTTTNTNASKADIPAVNITITPVPSADQWSSTGQPTGGQFTPPSGQLPQGTDRQMPPSGQSASAAVQTSATGQIPAGSGQAVPSGQVTQSGQTTQAAPALSGSGQVPSTGQIPSDTSQLTSGTGQYMSGTGSMPASGMSSSLGIGDLSADLASIFNGQTGMASPATATPNPDLSFFNNMTSMIANQQSGT